MQRLGPQGARQVGEPRESASIPDTETPGGSRDPCKAAASLSPSRFAKTVPKMATPKDAPMDRKKVAPDVATPRSSYETAFCTISTSTCMTSPSPSPNTQK